MSNRQTLLLIASPLLCVLIFFSPRAPAQSFERVNDSDCNTALPATLNGFEEVFSDGDSGIVYINWKALKETNGFSCAWFLGAYRIVDGRGVTSEGSDGVAVSRSIGENTTLCVDLDRTVLRSNDLYCAINYSIDRAGQPVPQSISPDEQDTMPGLFLNLCDTNADILAESDNLLTFTNLIWYADGTNVVLLLSVPTAKYPDAAVIQLRSSYSHVGRALAASSSASEDVIVKESLLFTDAYADYLASHGQGNGTTNHAGGSLSNLYDKVNGNGSSTNASGGNSDGNGGGSNDDDSEGKIIYVDQALGNDSYSGRSAGVGRALAASPSDSAAATQKGPKKTIRSGLSIAGSGDTIVIRPGDYKENLNVSGKNVKVKIEGKVKL